MDPLSIIVMALATGAAAVGQSAIKDSYAAVRALLVRRFSSVGVDVLERDPSSPARQEVIKEDLARSGAADDRDVLAHIEQLLEAISQGGSSSAPGTKAVDLKQVRAAQIMIKSVIAEGKDVSAFTAQDVTVGGTFWVEGVEARSSEPDPKD
jgi:hypothetical protein